jgi:transcription initiation factor TFIIB
MNVNELYSDVAGFSTIHTCPECNNTHIIRDYACGNLVCATCGLIIDELVLDEQPEWRAFTKEERSKKSRVGDPTSPLKIDYGLGTTIDKRNQDGYGNLLSPRRAHRINRLRWLHDRNHRSVTRNLSKALAELKRLASQLGFPMTVRNEAAIIYRKALRKRLIRGRSIDGMVAASLYLVSRSQGLPRTLREIAAVSRLDKKEIARCYRVLCNELNLKLPPTDATNMVPRLSNDLGLSASVQRRAIQILKEAENLKLCIGKNPMSLAAAALYIAAIEGGERRTQQEVAEVAQTTEVTLRNRYKELKRELNI